MKNLILFILFIFSLSFAGCKKDSERNDITGNYLEVNGVKYEISKGFLINFGEFNSTFSIDVYLMSSGVIVNENMGLPEGASGTGHGIDFQMISSSGDKLALGDYVLNNSELAGSVYAAGYILSCNFTQNPTPDLLEITSGTVKVITSGTEYELSFAGKDKNNKTISCYYKGSLKYYNGQ